jgi:asparagine synthase (glutamine-hydrolysing)
MSTPDGRYHLVYNGEIYNDKELRAELLRMDAVPGGFQSQCDTETVLFAFATWGPAAFGKLRGMFAIGIYDTHRHELHLARDPLGMKPLYYHHAANGEITFASDPAAILRHPQIDAEPDLTMVSAYLTTLRSTLGHRTLFAGVHTLQPGERAVYKAKTRSLDIYEFVEGAQVGPYMTSDEAVDSVRESIEDSVQRHLRSDVPVCNLLSGGLDSTILCAIEKERGVNLRTWCAGGPEVAGQESDMAFARAAAQELGTQHHEVTLGRKEFTRDWHMLIREQGLPLSTPNEVAIYQIAKDLRSAGQVVAISGEGADELFGGYEPALQSAWHFAGAPGDRRSAGRYQLDSMAWVSPNIKPQVLSEDAWNGAGADRYLHEFYDKAFARAQKEVGPNASQIDPFLRFQRHDNLRALLQRLDTATMMASVEGRTPFADWEVTRLAESLPMSTKFIPTRSGPGGGAAIATVASGKIVLRDAWREQIPASILKRQKHSFPLPFEKWVEDSGWQLESSPFAHIFFQDKVRESVVRDPNANWQFAWPMMNLAMWGDRWWANP